MSYTILSVAYPLTPVGEDTAGGAEQVLAMLDRALTCGGHRSLVIAAEGSTVAGTLIASPKARGIIDDNQRQWACGIHADLIRHTLATHQVDLIHMHAFDFHRYLPDGHTPVLATLHLPPDWYPPGIFHLQRENFYLNCVSHSQRRACPDSARLVPVIPNGVDVNRLNGGAAVKGNYALALGRICPEKGFHYALDAAKKAGIELVLGGEITPYAAHQEYFKRDIIPRLDRSRQYVGQLGFERKKQLLAGARCLLVPSTVQETSSLVSMESLAAGTPVIAFRSGALPEIVEHGRTGYLVTNADEMAAAIESVDRIDPEECRRVACRYFSQEVMVSRYIDMYNHLIFRRSYDSSQTSQIECNHAV